MTLNQQKALALAIVMGVRLAAIRASATGLPYSIWHSPIGSYVGTADRSPPCEPGYFARVATIMSGLTEAEIVGAMKRIATDRLFGHAIPQAWLRQHLPEIAEVGEPVVVEVVSPAPVSSPAVAKKEVRRDAKQMSFF